MAVEDLGFQVSRSLSLEWPLLAGVGFFFRFLAGITQQHTLIIYTAIVSNVTAS